VSAESEAGGAWGWNSQGCPADAQEAAEWVGAETGDDSEESEAQAKASDKSSDALHDPAASPWIRDHNTDEIKEAERSNAPLPGELEPGVTPGPAYGAPPDYGPAATTGAPAWTITSTTPESSSGRHGFHLR